MEPYDTYGGMALPPECVLDSNKLEGLRRKGDGALIARCPACAVLQKDTKRQHLIIYSDGKYGCVVFTKDELHRKSIFAEAGKHGKRSRETLPIRKININLINPNWNSNAVAKKGSSIPDNPDGGARCSLKL